MRIAPASDLHLEFPNADRRKALSFPKDVDVILLGGDIASGRGVVDEVLELSNRYPRAHIVWVAGNHEFYGLNIDIQTARFREACAAHERVHFLENDSVEIDYIRFVGCTLWTDFSILGAPEESISMAGRAINDFVLI